ncbi:metallophosphoesterase [Roseisalinus antarcticus]|uniref:Serine/threonine-protein phosphatase 1 n=1 Tax=Roseisalinus antarcticus TaxID=254357 RepID=A0A1Y5S916_9RHOB|nr:metallophosphoesterase [Roseisalinus antarcticus]SLN34124.1 Serine/threonine-protein phosphatase 1 [Roseisalinus antarcticus]
MKTPFANLFSRRATFEPPAPREKIQVIGDIHGSLRQLERLGEMLDPGATTIFVGDYVDRGEDSATVLRRLHEVEADSHGAIHCLMGNHERMMLDFLAVPEDAGRFWLRNGGLQTLASFGVGGVNQTTTGPELVTARDALQLAAGKALLDWLTERPLMYSSGNVTVVHAGADPRTPMSEQQSKHLLWGHPNFTRVPRRDGIWVAHGHTIIPTPVAEAGRISVDTGAYATGRLTAAVIEESGVQFVST